MSAGLLFWIVMLLALVAGWWSRPQGATGAAAIRPMGFNIILFILLLVLGWKIFGPPINF